MVAKIAVEKTAYHFDGLFDYSIPAEMMGMIFVGCRVIVPFGRGNTSRQGMVIEISNISNYDKIKPIKSIVDKAPVLNEEMLEIVKFLKETTFCSWYDAVRASLPRGMNYKIKGDALKRLVGDNLDKIYTVNPELQGDIPELTTKQQKVVDFLLNNGDASSSEICYLCAVTAAVIKALVIKKIIIEYKRKVFRNPYEDIQKNKSLVLDNEILSSSQQNVMNQISALLDSENPDCALLHGITGSGKTKIFLKLIQKVLNDGKTAIMLVPEISLTPQMVENFKGYFGDNVAVLHSSLSLGEKLDEWERINNDNAKIVIGTRSAIFAPLENIGIIILDEEGEQSYKSDASPRYHAKDVAKFRCNYHNAVLLLASATPSLNSYQATLSQRYKLFELNQRYNNYRLPDVFIVDLQSDILLKHKGFISDILKIEINKNLEKNEQTLLLINRRGFNAFALCQSCHTPVKCENCSVSMTYHKINDSLMCHYCGYYKQPSQKCESCGKSTVMLWGMGTQRIEEEVSNLFPDARVMRIDTDVIRSRYDFEEKFKKFASGEYDIMIGTQMVAKGLDFPNLTLVGVLAIDQLLFAGDYKSSERVFSLITQVVGRSGRSEKSGRAFIQTYTPEHPVINLAAKQDYKSFFKQESAIRKETLSPPFCDICTFAVSGENEEKTQNAINLVLNVIKSQIEKDNLKLPLRVLGPTKPPIYRANGKYRMQILLKCKNTSPMRKFIKNILITAGSAKEMKDINFYADFEKT